MPRQRQQREILIHFTASSAMPPQILVNMALALPPIPLYIRPPLPYPLLFFTTTKSFPVSRLQLKKSQTDKPR